MTPQSVGLSGSSTHDRQALRPAGPPGQARASSATSSRARRSTRSTARRSRSPTRRRKSPTTTWSRSSSSGVGRGARRRSASRAGTSRRRTAARPRAWSRSRSAARTHAKAAIGNGPVDALFARRRRGASSRSSAGIRSSTTTRSRPSPAARTPRARCWCAAAARPTRARAPRRRPATGYRTNIIEASLEAYLVAVNKLHGADDRPASPAFVAPAHRGACPTRRWPTYRIAVAPGRRRRARGRRPAARRVARGGRGARFGFDDRLERSSSSAAPRSTPMAPRSVTEDLEAVPEPPTRSCSAPSAGRAGTTRTRMRPAGAGAVHAARRPRAVRQPAAGHRASGARAVVAAPPGAARGRRPADRPRADRRALLRAAVGGARHAGRRASADRHALPYTEARSGGSSGSRSSWPRAGAATHERRQGQRARDVAACGGRSSTRSAASSRTSSSSTGWSTRARCSLVTQPGAVRRARHREPVRRHPLGRGGGARGVARACCPRPRSAIAGRPTAGSGCTSRSTARRRTSPARTWPTRSARSCRRAMLLRWSLGRAGRGDGDRGRRSRRARRRLPHRATCARSRRRRAPAGRHAEMTDAVIERPRDGGWPC